VAGTGAARWARCGRRPWRRAWRPEVGHDHAVGGQQPAADNPQTAHDRAQFDRLGGNGAILADDQHGLARLIGLDRFIGHHQRLHRAAVGQAHVAEHAGRQEQLGVGDDRAPDRARMRVEAVVGEVQTALPVVAALILKLDLDLGGAVLGAVTLGLEEQGFGLSK
jgi:hypothetical protein